MRLLLERYEIKRQIEQLSERLKQIDEELLAEATPGEVLDIGNGGYYRVGVSTRTTYPIDAVATLPKEALVAEIKLSPSALDRLVKKKLITEAQADLLGETATVTTTKTLGQLKRFENDVLEAIESE